MILVGRYQAPDEREVDLLMSLSDLAHFLFELIFENTLFLHRLHHILDSFCFHQLEYPKYAMIK